MNISKAAWQALIPIERKMMPNPIEYAYQLDNKGKVLSEYIGNASHVDPFYIKDNLILTHNHPNTSRDNTYMSPLLDIKTSIEFKVRESRAVASDGFCHLVEIPKLKPSEVEKCNIILTKYDKKSLTWSDVRKMRKELEKAGGLKFRTIPLPK